METDTVKTTVVSQNPLSSNSATSKTTTTTSGSLGDFFVSKTNQVIFSIVAIIDLLIGLRFVFLLLGANHVGVVNFVLNLTDIFVAPTKGIFSSKIVEEGYFEPASVAAIIMWLVIGFILSMIISLFSTKTGDEVVA